MDETVAKFLPSRSNITPDSLSIFFTVVNLGCNYVAYCPLSDAHFKHTRRFGSLLCSRIEVNDCHYTLISNVRSSSRDTPQNPSNRSTQNYYSNGSRFDPDCCHSIKNENNFWLYVITM